MNAPFRLSIADLVKPDRVHKSVYTDPDLFEEEIRRVHYRTWIYIGHESQVPNHGDYYATRIAAQPVVMVRHSDDSIRVLYNRCGHKGVKVVGNRCGNAKMFRCGYHGWIFRTDGSLRTVPSPKGYEDVGFDKSQHGMMPLPRVENYRGFVFASMNPDVADLKSHLGPALSSIDDMVDRAPEGKLQVAGGSFRIMQRSNWKIFMENLNDGMHPLSTHQSSVDASVDEWEDLKASGVEQMPFSLKIMADNGKPFEFWENLECTMTENGHSWMGGIVSPKNTDPVFLDYYDRMVKAYGKERTDEILAVERHNTVIYPCMGMQSGFQQLRVINPIAVDRTLVEIWNFKLLGAPEEMYRRILTWTNVVNSPASLVMPDDIELYGRMQQGLISEGPQWVSFHRDIGREKVVPEGLKATVTSEMPMRNQFRAWSKYMCAAEA
jgi:phenylpropionate dioxygenase-like ring-hydroxylating dioxygenase large terminal subunit